MSRPVARGRRPRRGPQPGYFTRYCTNGVQTLFALSCVGIACDRTRHEPVLKPTEKKAVPETSGSDVWVRNRTHLLLTSRQTSHATWVRGMSSRVGRAIVRNSIVVPLAIVWTTPLLSGL